METLNEYHSKIGRIFDYAQRMIGVWDDIAEFFYEADERYKQVGALPMNFIDNGYWDDPYTYDATYENANLWGERRWSTPGVVIDGELVTTRLTDINIGWEEFVEHSYYERWSGHRYETDEFGQPLSPFHPWNKRTLPKPTEKSWKARYTWATSPRWDRKVVEAGAYARLFITALAQKHPPSRFFEADGRGIRMFIPKGFRHEVEVEWTVPEVWNAFERNRGRAYHYLFSQLVAFESLLQAYEMVRSGEQRVAAVTAKELERRIPKEEARGIGFWGAGRGFLTHYLSMEQGKLVNYQIVTPSTINAAPRDPWDQPGAYEEAVMRTPILEEISEPDRFTSIDMLR